jgi:hypothetical protein
MIQLNIEGLEQVRARFARLIPETQQQVLNGLAQVAFDSAQRQADTHTKTGALARSLFLKPEGDKAWVIGHDQQHAPHAVFVHWGTRPHVIKPKSKKVLRWAGGSGGGTGFIFARFVNHPGYRGDAWLVKAADDAVKQFDAIVNRVNLGA